MSNQELEELQKEIIANAERKAMDISQYLDLLTEEVKLGTLPIREAISKAFLAGLRT